ncbi:hypothetical protein, partial [Pseudomonas sp. CFII68]|uniref:hypothetical protein n=1 Tax=Pseudomonas sp. CFII68 TaxID=911243 RepID=UPI001C464768
ASKPAPTLDLCAPHQCTANRNCACTTSQNHRPRSKKTAQIKTKAPEYGAFRITSGLFVTSHLKLARPLQ